MEVGVLPDFSDDEKLPKFAAGFTVDALQLRDRLECLLHGVVCEVDDKDLPEVSAIQTNN